jgi:hypothetical protein
MSLVTFYIDDMLHHQLRPVNIFDQHFGMGMLHPIITAIRAGSQTACYTEVFHVQVST